MHEIISEIVDSVDFKGIRCIKGYNEIARDYSSYLCDESKLAHQGAQYLFFPANEGELSAIFQEMAKRDVKITISGARTGLVGGAVPCGGAIVSLEKFDKILGLRYDNRLKEWLVKAECGVTIRDLNNWAMKKVFPGLSEGGSAETKAFLERYKESKTTYFYPPDPTEMGAALGGTVSTNASGARTYRYGPTRNWVRCIRVMLASGEVLEIPRGKCFATPSGEFTIIDSKGNETGVKIPRYTMPSTKNAAGIFSAPNMDLIDLFIGSEGIFGAITEVEIALQKWHNPVSIVQFLPSDDKAIDSVVALRKEKSIRPEFIEFYSSHALDLLRNKQDEDPKVVGMPPIPDYAKSAVFFDLRFDPESKDNDYSKLEEIVCTCGSTLAKSWAGYEQRDLERFKNFRHVLPETVNSIIAERKKKIPELYKLGTDLAVPDQALEKIWAFYKSKLEKAGLEWVAFGHIGNNHIHINIIPRSLEEMKEGLSIYREFAKKAVSLGGTISAEHGIGKIKKEFFSIMFSDKELKEMKAVKIALDPGLILNPGNMLNI
ncbi:MAG: FAD-binding oxidoreductase [Deltaproteobacteria bacterium]|nr:FAD-binding oxidoreductase [Deltaproteobacteria bacterium]